MSPALPPDFDDADTDPGRAHAARPASGAASLGTHPARPSEMSAKELVEAEGAPRFLGRLILLAMYLLAVSGWIALSYFGSADYKIAAGLARGDQLLGKDAGQDTESAVLIDAARAYLDVLLIDPDVLPAHQHLESIKWRFQERHIEFPIDLQRQHGLLAAKSAFGKVKEGAFDSLPVTAENRFNLSGLKNQLFIQLGWMSFGALLLLGWMIVSHLRARAEYEARRRRAEKLNQERGSALY